MGLLDSLPCVRKRRARKERARRPRKRSVKDERYEELLGWYLELKPIAEEYGIRDGAPAFEEIDFIVIPEPRKTPEDPLRDVIHGWYQEPPPRIYFTEDAYGRGFIMHELAHALCDYPDRSHLHEIFRDPRMG